jgi:hypothetical protein
MLDRVHLFGVHGLCGFSWIGFGAWLAEGLVLLLDRLVGLLKQFNGFYDSSHAELTVMGVSPSCEFVILEAYDATDHHQNAK